MKTYTVWVKLECEYEDIEAENEEEAFRIASEYAMSGGTWNYEVRENREEELK